MEHINFNSAWQFHDLQTGKTQILDLPHDATIGTQRNPNLRNYFLTAGYQGGQYEYKKKFFVPQDYSNKTIWLHFDGVYQNAHILLNGKELHLQEYGYVPFDVRLDGLRFGCENEVCVFVDVPVEAHTRWYAGSGIYRPVTLCVAEKTHIPQYGVKITTISHSPAVICVSTTVEDGLAISPEVQVEIFDGEKKIAVGRGTKCEIEIPNAKLWTAETPHLYRAVVSLLHEGRTVESTEEQFGVRTLSWSAEKGFCVNGVRTLLRGGCIHADNGVIGCVTNDVTEERRVCVLKATGFNAVRSAHHPMSPSLLRACDKLGLYVMDEAWDTWYRMKQLNGDSKHFLKTYLQDTRAMVENDYNHPCVVMYSLGNEIPEIGSLKAYKIARNMIKLVKSIDGTRPLLVAAVLNTARAYLKDTPYYDTDEDEYLAQSEENAKKDWQHYIYVFTKALSNNPTKGIGVYPEECIAEDEHVTDRLFSELDMAGYNYYTDKFEVLHKLHPERLLVGTETRGNLIVRNWELIKNNPYAVGDFIWTLQDHLGETNVGGKVYANQQVAEGPFGARSYPYLTNDDGVVDLNGLILPSIHKFRFAWGEYRGLYLASQPPVHEGNAPQFNSYNWTDTIESWTYEGCEGNKTFIDVYTDAYEAEALVNGKSLGRKRPEEFFAKFPAIYEAGEVVGIGYDEKGNELYRTVMQTAGKETKLTVSADKSELKANGEDFVYLDIAVTDRRGVVKALPERVVKVQVEGAGVLQGLGSANPVNAESFTGDTHTTYHGRLLAVVRSSTKQGEIDVKISSKNIEEINLKISVR